MTMIFGGILVTHKKYEEVDALLCLYYYRADNYMKRVE